MGNNCVGPNISRNGFFQSVSTAIWRTRSPDDISISNGESVHDSDFVHKKIDLSVQDKPPEQMTMPKVEVEAEHDLKEEELEKEEEKDKGNLEQHFFVLRKQLGRNMLAKQLPKADEDAEDVRREIQIMHHLAGHPNVVSIKGAYEDPMAVHLVMELCAGGELFDRIIKRGHYTERKAANLTRVIVGIVEACHSLGVMHRDLKPENFLFVNQQEDSLLKTIDFGLSMFFKPGDKFSDVLGSPYYVAPEVLQKRYGPEADVCSAGNQKKASLNKSFMENLTFHQIHGPVSQKVLKTWSGECLLETHTKNALQLTKFDLCHPWIQVDGVAPDKPLDSAVLSRLKQFSAMNKLKKMAFRIIAESLSSEEEKAGLKEMFKMIDADNSGQITFEELKIGLKKVGANLKENEIYDLMQAVIALGRAKQADVDNNGTIDYGEFIAAMLQINKIEREDHLFGAFSYFDKDGSGYITPDELQLACEEFGLDFQLEEMIEEVDQDNDGYIDYNEFIAMMQKGNPATGPVKRLENSFGIAFRDKVKA
ncbi:hypothetical protein QQ045_004908 [Rhodiola kirilowii]